MGCSGSKEKVGVVANAPTDIKSAENSTPVKAPTNAGGGGGGASAPKVTPIGTRVGQLRGEIDVVVSPGTGSPSSATGGAGGKPQSARSHGSSGMPLTPGRGVDLHHHESRVQMALSSKRLALSRSRRGDVKAESFKNVLATLDDDSFSYAKVPKDDETKAFIRKALGANFLFAGLQAEVIEKVVDAFAPLHVAAEVCVVEQGNTLDQFYVLHEGECEVFVDGESHGHIDAGGHFGDLALLYGSPSASRINAVSACKFWVLDRATFRGMIVRVNARDVQANYRFLRKVKMLQGLGSAKLNKLAEALSPVKFNASDYIIRQGEEGNIFYIVKKGVVRVTKNVEGGKEEDLIELSVGDHFGERALLRAEPRAANVVARGHVTCMALDRDFFVEMLGPLKDMMERTHSEREVTAERNRIQREETKRLETKAMEEEGQELRKDIKLADLQPMSVLGEGAFGVVQLVRHRKSKEVFALKKMQKARIVKTGQQQNVVNEKRVLSTCKHPYILKLVASFQDKDCLYMLLEFLQGGDIFGHLYKQGGRFSYHMSQYYAATVLTVLDYLHRKKVAYRDLKPENLVLDSRGHLKVVDFGFAKTVTDRTYTLCGTPEYLAPELVQGKGHNKAVDYWALGILIYEMFSGYSPFADEENNDQLTIYKNIIRGKIVFSSKVREDHVKDIISRLLTANPSARLGCLKGGADDVKAHAFFKKFDFAALMKKKLLPPIIPEVHGATDTSNFDEVEVEASKVIPYEDDGTGWADGF